jgi:hypothetical protein
MTRLNFSGSIFQALAAAMLRVPARSVDHGILTSYRKHY